jgi:hypothetical protein
MDTEHQEALHAAGSRARELDRRLREESARVAALSADSAAKDVVVASLRQQLLALQAEALTVQPHQQRQVELASSTIPAPSFGVE